GDVQDHVPVLGGPAAVPALEQIAHHHADLAPLAAEHLLQLPGEHRVRPLGPGVVLQALVVEEHGHTSGCGGREPRMGEGTGTGAGATHMPGGWTAGPDARTAPGMVMAPTPATDRAGRPARAHSPRPNPSATTPGRPGRPDRADPAGAAPDRAGGRTGSPGACRRIASPSIGSASWNAAMRSGENCLPRSRRISCAAWAAARALRYARDEVSASNVSASVRTCVESGISDPARPLG